MIWKSNLIQMRYTAKIVFNDRGISDEEVREHARDRSGR